MDVLRKMMAGVKRIEAEFLGGTGFTAGANHELKRLYENKIKLIEEFISGYKHTQDKKQP